MTPLSAREDLPLSLPLQRRSYLYDPPSLQGRTYLSPVPCKPRSRCSVPAVPPLSEEVRQPPTLFMLL